MRKEQLWSDDIFVIHDFMSPSECERFIAASESAGFGDAPIGSGADAVVVKGVRNNDRVIVDDPAAARGLYERALPFLPTAFEGWRPCGFNERFRFYRYTSGQKFDWHFDGEYHRGNGEESKFTFMIYLNGGVRGGETLFHLHEGTVNDDVADLRIAPAPGKALVFRHDVLHTGAVVLDGVKYVMRTDVMFRPAGA